MHTTTRSILTLSAVLMASNLAQAAVDPAQELYDKGLELWAHRAESLQISENILTTLNQAEAMVQDQDLKYDILVLESRTLYWKGQHTDGDENKKIIHLAGRQKADEAVSVNKTYAEGYYYAGINLGRWAEANGIVSSIQHKGELIKYMKDASDASRTTRSGDDGEAVDGYGPDRTLGRMYKKLPGILGGDHGKSLVHLRKAVANAPGNALSVVYLADTLLSGPSGEKAEAKILLQNLVAQDPAVFGAELDRVPETKEEFKLAQDLLDGKSLP